MRGFSSLPGVGPTLAAVLACEIDQIARFPNADKLCGYAGIVPATHSSGGKVHHGRLLAFVQQVAALGLDRSELGFNRLFALLWRTLFAASGPVASKPTQPSPSSLEECAASSGSS